MGDAPKGKCKGCDKRFTLELKGQEWVIPWHQLRVKGPNPPCSGVGKPPA